MKLIPPNITPGDWHVEGDSVLSPKGETIAICPTVFIFEEEKANVRAIAALPELLKFAELFISWKNKAPMITELTLAVLEMEAEEALEKAGYTIEP